MSTYKSELRVCKICGKTYEADVLMSSNSFSQSLESINEEIRRHSYWLCDNCWEDRLNKPDIELKVYIPSKSDFEKQKNAIMNQEESLKNESLRFNGYYESLKHFNINNETYTKFLFELFNCLSAEVIAQNKPYILYIDSKEFESNYVWGKQTIGYLFDPTQKGPNISISYNLTTYSGNIFHMFPKIIVNSGFTYNFMSHGRNLEISKKISGHGISWKLDVETHKVIRELKKSSYSWMETSYISNEIEYHQHIYFSTSLIQDLIRVFDNYYRVFGDTFEKLRKMFLYQKYRSVNENLEIYDDFSTIREMRLYHDPFIDV